ncbi:MAG: hypothetical protein MK212_04190 [Saprospiraceae bacterium]|nr:hypothetical protein [Saprospiraceae bacterium]
MKKIHLSFFISLLCFSSCTDKDMEDQDKLRSFLLKECHYVHEIDDFYIVSSNDEPHPSSQASAKEIFEHSVRLFSNFLDQDEDGVIDTDKANLLEGLKNNLMFVSGESRFVDGITDSKVLSSNDIYGIAMKTDDWPYVASYDGSGWSLSQLETSMWRPENYNALWEEVFHTITEAYNRIDNDFSFTSGGFLRECMDNDINAGTYDISEQNEEENGDYDKVTAVNEYIHQIWLIHTTGQATVLNEHQKKALDFMIDKNIPMQINPNYSLQLGTRLKE